MRKTTTTAILIASLAALSSGAQTAELSGRLSLSGAWAIYPLAVKWGEAFHRIHPKVKLDISAGGAGKGMADALSGAVDIGMVSREIDKTERARGAVPVFVARDGVFPTVAERNPALKQILTKGVTRKTLRDIYINGSAHSWKAAGGPSAPIHAYTRSDACGAASAWASTLGKFKQEDLKGVGVYGDPGVLEAVRRDPLGIGYNNLGYLFSGRKLTRGIRIVPIDANSNGKVDSDELIDSRDKAYRAVASGRYLGARREFLVTKGKPSALARAFIDFALSDAGTKILNKVGGYVAPSASERSAQLRKIR